MLNNRASRQTHLVANDASGVREVLDSFGASSPKSIRRSSYTTGNWLMLRGTPYIES